MTLRSLSFNPASQRLCSFPGIVRRQQGRSRLQLPHAKSRRFAVNAAFHIESARFVEVRRVAQNAIGDGGPGGLRGPGDFCCAKEYIWVWPVTLLQFLKWLHNHLPETVMHSIKLICCKIGLMASIARSCNARSAKGAWREAVCLKKITVL